MRRSISTKYMRLNCVLSFARYVRSTMRKFSRYSSALDRYEVQAFRFTEWMCNTRIFRSCSRALYFYYRDAAFQILRIQIALCRPAFIRLLAVERARAAGGAGHFAVAFSRPLQYPRGRIQATKRLVDRRGSGVCSKRTTATQRHRGTSIRIHICVSTCDMFEGIHMCSCMPPLSR